MMNVDPQMKKMVLAWPTDVKLKAIRQAVDEGSLATALVLSQIMLDAPMKDGGVPSELIQEAMLGSN